MSVIIKGMKMPKSCCDCKFVQKGSQEFCGLLLPDIKYSENWERRPTFCPLVDIPPHGNLIDRDALLNKLQALYDEREDEARYTGSKEIKISWNDAVYQIVGAPTIIPAKEGEL